MEIKRKLKKGELWIFLSNMAIFVFLFALPWARGRFTSYNGFSWYFFGQLLSITTLSTSIMIMLPLFDINISDYIGSVKGKEDKIKAYISIFSVVLGIIQSVAVFLKVIFTSGLHLEIGILANLISVGFLYKGIEIFSNEKNLGIKLPKTNLNIKIVDASETGQENSKTQENQAGTKNEWYEDISENKKNSSETSSGHDLMN